MKRISKVTVIALTAFLLLGSLPVLAVDGPFALRKDNSVPPERFHLIGGEGSSEKRPTVFSPMLPK
jgi:hypothetical protein